MIGVKELVKQLKVLVVFAEDTGPVPSIPVKELKTKCVCSTRDSSLFYLPCRLHTCGTHICTQTHRHSHTHRINKSSFKKRIILTYLKLNTKN